MCRSARPACSVRESGLPEFAGRGSNRLPAVRAFSSFSCCGNSCCSSWTRCASRSRGWKASWAEWTCPFVRGRTPAKPGRADWPVLLFANAEFDPPMTSRKNFVPSNKKPARSTLLSSLKQGRSAKSRRSIYRLRKCAGQENCSVLRAGASRPHQEHDILPALHTCLDLCKVVGTIHGLLIHFENHVSAIQAEIFRE
jgi:hypothetical protein